MQNIGRTLAATLAAASLAGCAPAISGSAESITRLEHARTADPHSEAINRSLGIAYFRADRYADARAALAAANAADPTDGVAALYLGMTAEAQNDLPAARTAYEKYLAVGRTRGTKNQIRDRLQALQLREIHLAAKQALADEAARGSVAGPRNTVAVMPFTFSGPDTSLKPLERGFAELVTTDLSRAPQLTVLERMQLQALLDEISLQQTNAVAQGTGVRAGKMLRVGRVVGGSIQQTGNALQASALVTDVATTSVGNAATDQRALDQVFTLEKNIVLQLFTTLGVQLTTAQRNAIEERPTRSLAAFVAFSRGLELEDRGRFDEASRSFDQAVRLDPGFGAAQVKSAQTKAAAAGAQVSTATVESSLKGTAEGATAAGGATTGATGTGGTVTALAEGLNPSPVAGATSGMGSTTTQPSKDPSSSTGADNVSARTARVTITIHKP